MIKEHKTPKCTNCSYEFIDANNYCPVCGQKNHELRLPLKHLLEEVLESTLHFDSKTFRTIKLLLLKPGFLSNEFNSGRRTNYVPPIRLYVLISFVFFFLLSLLTGGHKSNEEHGKSSEEKTKMTFSYQTINSSELKGRSFQQADSLMIAKKIELTNFNKYVVHQLCKIANSSSAEFTHLLLKSITYMMFLLMPVFGAWIYLFNRKRLQYYIESLTISIHFHSYAFVIFTFLLLPSSVVGMEIFFLLQFFILPFYMLFMFRRVMNQSWLITIGKTVIVGTLYLVSFLMLLVITILISAIFI